MTYGPDLSMFISEKAARWGADQELEACCEWLEGEIGAIDPNDLRAARRPNPSSIGLETRIKELQEEIRSLRISYLRLVNAVARIMPNRAKFFADLNPDSND